MVKRSPISEGTRETKCEPLVLSNVSCFQHSRNTCMVSKVPRRLENALIYTCVEKANFEKVPYLRSVAFRRCSSWWSRSSKCGWIVENNGALYHEFQRQSMRYTSHQLSSINTLSTAYSSEEGQDSYQARDRSKTHRPCQIQHHSRWWAGSTAHCQKWWRLCPWETWMVMPAMSHGQVGQSNPAS